MSADINFICITGRLVKDIEIKEIGQTNLVSGTIASNRLEKKGEEWAEVPNFVDFKTWVKSPKQVEFYKSVFTKGSKLIVNGDLRMESWEKDGQKHSKLLINATKIESMGISKKESSPTGQCGNEKVANYNQDSGFPEDIPF